MAKRIVTTSSDAHTQGSALCKRVPGAWVHSAEAVDPSSDEDAYVYAIYNENLRVYALDDGTYLCHFVYGEATFHGEALSDINEAIRSTLKEMHELNDVFRENFEVAASEGYAI